MTACKRSQRSRRGTSAARILAPGREPEPAASVERARRRARRSPDEAFRDRAGRSTRRATRARYAGPRWRVPGEAGRPAAALETLRRADRTWSSQSLDRRSEQVVPLFAGNDANSISASVSSCSSVSQRSNVAAGRFERARRALTGRAAGAEASPLRWHRAGPASSRARNSR